MISTTTLFLITAFFHILYSGYLTVSYDHLLSESVLLVLRSLIDIGMVMKKYALHKAIVCWREIHALPGNNATPTTIQGGNRYQKAQQKKEKKTIKNEYLHGEKILSSSRQVMAFGDPKNIYYSSFAFPSDMQTPSDIESGLYFVFGC